MYRSALLVASVAAFAMFSAGSAFAAVTATTGPVTAVTSDGATFSGTVTTGGAGPVPWQFSYCVGGSSFQCTFSTGGVIPAGATAPTPVTDTVTGLLNPSTPYTVTLVATAPGAGGFSYLQTSVFGLPPVPFTTTGPGAANLTSTKLKVKRGRVEVGIKCGKLLDCAGGVLAITARHAGKKIACGSATFTVAAGTTKTVSTSKISAKCKALLVLAKKHVIPAKLTAGFTFQKGISASVKLKLG
jgi:hypothetical protein